MSIRAILSQCRSEQSWADVDLSVPYLMLNGPRLMSIRAVLGQCRVVQVRANVESPGTGLMSSSTVTDRVVPGRCWVVWAQDVEWSGPKPMLSRVGLRPSWVGLGPVWAEYWVDSSRLGWILSRVGPGRCLLKSVHAHAELSLSGPIWSRARPGRCRAVQARANIERSGLRLILRGAGPGWCRFVRAQANVESFGPRLISNWAG